MKQLPLASLLTFLLLLLPGCSSAKGTPVPPALQITPPANMSVVEGKLRNQISRLEKDMPRANSEGFVIPTDEQKQAFFAIVSSLGSGKLEEALSASAANGYELLWYTDQNDNNAVDYVLREIDPAKNGWGLYIFRAGATSNVIIEAPHPIYDEGTPDLAADVFRALDARALLVAGAHRDANRDGSADVSDQPQTIFQAVHEAEIEQSMMATGSAIVLQIHGFRSSKHPAYPQVIISYEHGNDTNPIELVEGQQLAGKIVNALNANGVKAGLCNGKTWRDLCGSTNIQAVLMTRGVFIHIELDETIRAKDKKFIEALISALAN